MHEKKKNTPELWTVDPADLPGGDGHIVDKGLPSERNVYGICTVGDGWGIATVDSWSPEGDSLADAERIVACVNACAGIADPSVVPDLVAALGGLLDVLAAPTYTAGAPKAEIELRFRKRDAAVTAARAALARVRGEGE